MPLAEQRPDVGGYESRVIEGVLHAVIEGPLPEIVSVVEHLGTGRLGAVQQEMNGRQGPYELNTPLAFNLFTLDQPFFVLATQNPIEQEGTYPLPEAQLDRFLLHVQVGYPNAEQERSILVLNRNEAKANKRDAFQPPELLSVASVMQARQEILEADALLTLSHFKCHELTGFGGALKNLGMGCGAKGGKLEMHSRSKPYIDEERCTACLTCHTLLVAGIGSPKVTVILAGNCCGNLNN